MCLLLQSEISSLAVSVQNMQHNSLSYRISHHHIQRRVKLALSYSPLDPGFY